MSLERGDYAAADGPYLRANGTEVGLAYLEVVLVLKAANALGEVFVEGLDSRVKTWILESSLTPQKARPEGWTP